RICPNHHQIFTLNLSSFDVVNNVNFGNTQNKTEQFYLELISGNDAADIMPISKQH
ncbi:MAG: hypothetical protein HW410_1666, partial [Nitrosarchaeum sp.]|nr:hypothetical protein [Nitrosarchaeum sp.]